jgi:hypothetical protein
VNYLFHYSVGPVDEHAAPQSHADSSHRNHFAATGSPSGHRAEGCCGRGIGTGDLDDGLPRGFLAGAIVKIWLAHRLDWDRELLGRRGEEGLIYETVNRLVGVILK